MNKTEYMIFKFKQSIENIGVAYESGLLSREDLDKMARAKMETCNKYPQAIRDRMKDIVLTWYEKYI
jgi:hypothetical protein